ncbi:holin family protein [Rummeliibacillus sp. TYF-LIM-RU47]|uniref:phage holin family protein n=1 Tax=Rummeliibacillus sp. TYF-LIM-RU47 TaxID=2608406 RepID=UPI001238C049|nr:phage holin family protein [Rummeliibacillus sp. TYF-LIM-RU47]
MEKLIWTLTLTLTGLTWLIGDWHVSLSILVVFMTFDFITGIIKSWITGEVSSKKGFKGILKKCMYFVALIVANMLDLLIGGVPVFRTMVAYYLIAVEAISLIENLEAMNVPLPQQLKEKFAGIRENNNK